MRASGGEFPLPDGIESRNDRERSSSAASATTIRPSCSSPRSDAGQLGLVRLGAPTNTVQGAPAADLALESGSRRMIAVDRLSGEPGAARCASPRRRSAETHLRCPTFPEPAHDIDDGRLIGPVARSGRRCRGHRFRDLWGGVDQMPDFWPVAGDQTG